MRLKNCAQLSIEVNNCSRIILDSLLYQLKFYRFSKTVAPTFF